MPGEDGRFNIARSLVGSEGTLVTVLEAKCRLIDAQAERVILMLGYPDVYEAADHVMRHRCRSSRRRWRASTIGCTDNIEKKGGPHRRYIRMLPDGKGWLMAEFGADTQEEALDIAHRVMEMLKSKPGAPTHEAVHRQGGYGASVGGARVRRWARPRSFPANATPGPDGKIRPLPPEKLGGYLRDLRALYNKYEYNPALYGHFGQGCVHCRVDFDLTSEPGIRKWRSFMEEATDLCVKYGGSLSGEHGDGQARGEFLYKMFGEELIQAFREFKSIWDPDWKMNPGKVVDPYRMDENLRLGADYKPWEPETHFQVAGRRRQLCACNAALRWHRQVPPQRRHERRRRHHVSQLHGDARGAAHHARPRSSSVGDAERRCHREWLAR